MSLVHLYFHYFYIKPLILRYLQHELVKNSIFEILYYSIEEKKLIIKITLFFFLYNCNFINDRGRIKISKTFEGLDLQLEQNQTPASLETTQTCFYKIRNKQ